MSTHLDVEEIDFVDETCRKKKIIQGDIPQN